MEVERGLGLAGGRKVGEEREVNVERRRVVEDGREKRKMKIGERRRER